ncbi:type III toxin-antitoxin system ToxN/AbiQ family toxin [Veillonella sp. R32]|uniref:type III toxin-antitoxin system ToxN/AbiQ family toxin n=1 Tax=Veillonella sp. R32 TaxID=2021312 RepID=UPI0021035889|nr:type III toxin-antitoxin system ToxN/AbiQ family toxin [Veillonella sp. R32]
MGVLDLKKMIPVPDGAYERIDFKCIGDNNYKNLLQKEYSFCLSVKEKIIKHVQKIYEKRNNNYKIRFSCDFNKLEKALEDWILNFKD